MKPELMLEAPPTAAGVSSAAGVTAVDGPAGVGPPPAVAPADLAIALAATSVVTVDGARAAMLAGRGGRTAAAGGNGIAAVETVDGVNAFQLATVVES